MTIFGVLDSLNSEEFDLPLTFYSTPNALRRRLLQSEEVDRVRVALLRGALTEPTVERFVSNLMEDLKQGQRFPHEIALAGLAVALEGRYTEFSRKYLETLASLTLSEMTLSIGVAKLALEQRSAKPIIVDLGPQALAIESKEIEDSDPTLRPERGPRSPNFVQLLKPTGTC